MIINPSSLKNWHSSLQYLSSRIIMPLLSLVIADRVLFSFMNNSQPLHLHLAHVIAQTTCFFQMLYKISFLRYPRNRFIALFLGKFLYFYHAMMSRGVFIAMILLSGKMTSRLTPLRKRFPVG